MLRKTKMKAHGKVDRQNEVSRIAGRGADPVRKAHLCFGINPKTSNLIILKEAIIKKKRIFRRTNSACIHYSFILLNIFLTTSL